MADGVVEYILRLTDKTKAGTRSAVQGSQRLENQTKETTRAVDHLGDESAQTSRQLTRMGRQSRGTTANLGRLAGGLTAALGSVGGLVSGVGGLVAVMGAGALVGTLTAATRAAFNFGQQVADLRNDISDASTRSGIATQTLQGLRLAAEGSGLSFSALTSGLDMFGRRLSEAAKGGNATADAFEKLKVKVTDSDGNLRSADEVLRELLSKLNQMPNDGERSALAIDTLGRSGGKLLQALSGSELEDFVSLAQEFGINVGPKAAQSAGMWQRASAELSTVLDGLKGEILDIVGGADALFQFTEIVLIAFEGLKGGIAGIAEGFDSAVNRIIKPFEILIKAVQLLLEGLGKIGEGDFTGGLTSLRSALSAVTDAAISTPAAIASALTGGVIEAGFTAGFRAAEGADVEGGARVTRLRELRSAILSTQEPTIGGGSRRDDEDETIQSAAERDAQMADLAATAAAAAGGVQRVGRAGGTLGVSEQMRENEQFLDSMVAATRAQRLETAQTAIGVSTQILGGDLGGGLSSIAGATGAAGLGVAGAAISGLNFIGEAGVKGIKESLNGLKDNLINAIKILPKLIGEVLPEFAIALISDLIPALIEAAPKLLFSLLVDLPVAIAKALVGLPVRLLRGEDKTRGARIGAVVGGTVGFLVGGPVGAAAGAGFGAAVGAASQDIAQGSDTRAAPVTNGPNAARTASDGQMQPARASDRLALASSRPRRSSQSVRTNPFDQLAQQFDSQFGTYGRASATTIGAPA